MLIALTSRAAAHLARREGTAPACRGDCPLWYRTLEISGDGDGCWLGGEKSRAFTPLHAAAAAATAAVAAAAVALVNARKRGPCCPLPLSAGQACQLPAPCSLRRMRSKCTPLLLPHTLACSLPKVPLQARSGRLQGQAAPVQHPRPQRQVGRRPRPHPHEHQDARRVLRAVPPHGLVQAVRGRQPRRPRDLDVLHVCSQCRAPWHAGQSMCAPVHQSAGYWWKLSNTSMPAPPAPCCPVQVPLQRCRRLRHLHHARPEGRRQGSRLPGGAR